MATHDNSHDKLFKAALADPRDAAMELRAVLPPALVNQIDFSSLEPVPGSFIDESMRGSQADLLYSATCATEEALLYVLMEHKSEVDRWTLLQLLRYMVRIWEQYLAQKPRSRALPPIIPVIVHHSETGWTAPTHFQGLFDPTSMEDSDLRRLTPEFEVQMDDLSHCTDQALRARAMGPAATLSFLFLRDGRREGRILDELLVWADLFRAVADAPDGQRAVHQLFSYLVRVAPCLGPEELAERIRRTMPERTDIVSTLAERWMEEGEQKGYRKLVRRQIELKFGAIDGNAAARIDAADAAELERFVERVLTATSVEGVFGE